MDSDHDVGCGRELFLISVGYVMVGGSVFNVVYYGNTFLVEIVLDSI